MGDSRSGSDASAGTAIRRATPADIPAIRSILAAHDNDGPVVGQDIVGPYVRHLVDHHRVLVSVDRSTLVVAFGAVVDAGVAAHLSDLFVRPDRLGHGIGRPLLAALFEDRARRTTLASADPRALPIYVRSRMAPLWVNLYLEGDPARLPGTPGVEAAAADPARLSELERRWTGADRPLDHAFWASQADADGFVITDADGPLAIAYARARQVSHARAIDRLVVRPGGRPVPAVVVALRRAARGGLVDASIPGPSPVLPVLLEAGFRVVDQDQYLASAPDLVDPARRLLNGGML